WETLTCVLEYYRHIHTPGWQPRELRHCAVVPGEGGSLAAADRRPAPADRRLIAVRSDVGNAVCGRQGGLPCAAFRAGSLQRSGGLYLPPEAGRLRVGRRMRAGGVAEQAPKYCVLELCGYRALEQCSLGCAAAPDRAQ